MKRSNEALLEYLLRQNESEFIEFKVSNTRPENIGQLVSALANGAVLQKKDEAYLIFGVDDTKNVVGTNFDPETAKHGNAPFKIWLNKSLKHAGSIEYKVAEHPAGRVVILVIPRATTYPVKFQSDEYVRVGEVKKRLNEHPELARKLWEEILRVSFEDGHASDLVDEEGVFQLLDFTPYYKLRGLEVPEERSVIIGHMINEGVLLHKHGLYFVSNLGALLFAKDMPKFDALLNRGVRLIKYKGNDKTQVERAFDGHLGYAIGVQDLIDVVMLLLPSEEYLEGGTRRTRRVYPMEAIRELTSNMLMHQDFSVSGYAPRIEIYDDRIEFTNPGSPVIPVSRFLDSNRSRNPKLAKLMRFMNLCEERGMGIDIVEKKCAQKYLPSLSIHNTDGLTSVTIFGHKSLRQFNSEDRINLVYTHSCLQWIMNVPMTNESLRSRFAEDVMSSTVASRWINEALDSKMIKPFDPTSQSRKHARYVPQWA